VLVLLVGLTSMGGIQLERCLMGKCQQFDLCHVLRNPRQEGMSSNKIGGLRQKARNVKEYLRDVTEK
jgi:hypothetical protein